MRILELISSHHWTGPAEHVLALAEHLAPLGAEVRVACSLKPPGNLPAKISQRGLAHQDDLILYKRKFHPLHEAKDIKTLVGHIKDKRFDILHSHLSNDHVLSLIAAGLARTPVKIVRTVHNSSALSRRPLRGEAFRRTDGIISLGREFAAKLEKSFDVDPRRIEVIPGAVNASRFAPLANRAEARRKYGLPEDAFLIGMVSRIKPGRGHPEMLDAFRVISARVPEALLVMIGRGELKAEMEQAVARLGLTDRIKFLGYIDEALPEAAGMLDLSVVLAEGSDGSCRAALEAMACGVPVLAAPVGTLPETIENDKTGVLMPAFSVRGLAEGAIRLAKNPDVRLEMGRQARRAVEERFTEERKAEATMKFLDRLMAG